MIAVGAVEDGDAAIELRLLQDAQQIFLLNTDRELYPVDSINSTLSTPRPDLDALWRAVGLKQAA